MDVIIVSKTRMFNNSCIGGVLGNGRFVRLLDAYGNNQDFDNKIEVGDVYTITFSERQDKRPPHVEDILLNSMEFKFSFPTINKMVDYLTNKLNVKVWRGSTETLFDGKVEWTNAGSGFISEYAIPVNSVGFWIPDQDLIRNDYFEKVRYSYPFRQRNIKFVGFQNPVDRIPAGTLVRTSLARWWSPNENEERCYLQLSGWYA